MATSMASAPVDEDSKIELYKDALYDACRASGTDQRLFSQQELLDLGAIPANDLMILKSVLQRLNDERLLISCQGPNGLAFKWREQSEAEKYVPPFPPLLKRILIFRLDPFQTCYRAYRVYGALDDAPCFLPAELMH